ncbi:MAG: sulfotransferase domain-containing protein [Planctomycetes bacterium]|nr:sulfotransferase domain-containing protein [Planctomycetota bacterium]
MKQVFLIGHPRCATTSIISMLSQVSDVAVSTPKEMRYFDIHYDKGLDWYESHYTRSTNKIVRVDGNPHHSYVNFAAERIKFHYPDAKIIQIVRSPFDRLYSWWQLFHSMRSGREPRTFPEMFKDGVESYDTDRFRHEGNWLPYLDQAGSTYQPFLLESGAYGTTYKRYLDLFGEENILTLPFEEVVKGASLVNEILKFIGSEEQLPDDFNLHSKSISEDWPLKNKRDVVGADEKQECFQKMYEPVMAFYTPELRLLTNLSSLDFFRFYL